jgi:hypothetical protein
VLSLILRRTKFMFSGWKNWERLSKIEASDLNQVMIPITVSSAATKY